jgi:hypothetical protein
MLNAARDTCSSFLKDKTARAHKSAKVGNTLEMLCCGSLNCNSAKFVVLCDFGKLIVNPNINYNVFLFCFGIWMRLIFSSLSCKITCHPAFFHKLPTFWAVKTNIQVSKGLTTSRGPGTAYMFALTLAEQLFGESVAREVAEFMVICFVN